KAAWPRQAARARGFTLIELMIVVAIVAVLGAIAYPSYADSVRKSKRGHAKGALVELAQRAERYRTVNGSFEDFWETVPEEHRVSPREGGVAYAMYFDETEGHTEFVLSATPEGGQTADTKCMTLTLDHAGHKDIDGGTGTAAECW